MIIISKKDEISSFLEFAKEQITINIHQATCVFIIDDSI